MLKSHKIGDIKLRDDVFSIYYFDNHYGLYLSVRDAELLIGEEVPSKYVSTIFTGKRNDRMYRTDFLTNLLSVENKKLFNEQLNIVVSNYKNGLFNITFPIELTIHKHLTLLYKVKVYGKESLKEILEYMHSMGYSVKGVPVEKEKKKYISKKKPLIEKYTERIVKYLKENPDWHLRTELRVKLSLRELDVMNNAFESLISLNKIEKKKENVEIGQNPTYYRLKL